MPTTIHATARSTASPHTIFEILANTEAWPEWSDFEAAELERPGTHDRQGVGAIRRFTSAKVIGREEVVEYEPPRRFSYRLLSGLPLKDYVGTVEIDPTPDGGSTIRWSARFRPPVPGVGWVYALPLKKFLRNLTEALARAASRPSARDDATP